MGSISPSSVNLTNRQATPAADLAQQAKQAQAQAAAQQAQQANLQFTPCPDPPMEGFDPV